MDQQFNNQHPVHLEQLNHLLKNEFAAIEAYERVLEKILTEPEAAPLRQITYDHRDAVNLIKKLIIQRGGETEKGTGAWGFMSRLLTETAGLFGETATFMALKEGEEHGLKELEEALQDSELDSESKTAIEISLIPRQRDHVDILDRLLKSA